MDFLSKIANRIPNVGLMKGLYHYASGEEENGHEAMYQFTRTLAVIAGGTFGGPVGAMAVGLATDCVASVVMKEDKGLVEAGKKIVYDIALKRDPTRSIVSTSFQLGLDGMKGSGGSYSVHAFEGIMASSVPRAMEETMASSVPRAMEETMASSVYREPWRKQ